MIESERTGRDRADKPDYKVKLTAAVCFSRNLSRLEYYHNSSWLEYGGAPEKAVRNAFVYAIDQYLKNNNKYKKSKFHKTHLFYIIIIIHLIKSNQVKKILDSQKILFYYCVVNFLRRNGYGLD